MLRTGADAGLSLAARQVLFYGHSHHAVGSKRVDHMHIADVKVPTADAL